MTEPFSFISRRRGRTIVASALAAASALLAPVGCGPAPAGPGRATVEAPARPNVLLVLSDTHRWGAMSFTRTPAVETPNLAALAAEGVSLDRHYSNLPLCTPYRAMLLTGRWPYQQGLIANHMRLADRVDLPEGQRTRGTLAWAFKDAGYRTAHIGKWHLGGEPLAADGDPPDAGAFGFDTSIVWTDTNNHRASRFSVDAAPWTSWQGRSNATETVSQALDWIRSGNAGRGGSADGADASFFLTVSLNPPHGPFLDALEEKLALYPDSSRLPFLPHDSLREWDRHRGYHALVSGIDDEIGRISAALDELGLRDDTIVLYTSDHGAMGGVDGVAYGQKRHPNDESTRVPFLVRWPGQVPAGVRRETLSSVIDVFPTLAGLTRLPVHLARANTQRARDSLAYVESLPGVDLSAHLLGREDAIEPASVFLMHPSNMNNRFSRPEPVWRAVVTRTHTYAVTERGEHALWDHARDRQDRDLLDDPELLHDSGMLETRMAHWRELERWMRVAEDPYVDRWFAHMPDREIAAWNREHGLGEDNVDRRAGRREAFDLLPSRPSEADPGLAARDERPPNVVLIMADDMGFSDIGPYGSEIATPALDALAAGGMRFTQFYNTARCSPTRASLLTGLYAHRAGVGVLNRDLGFDGYRGDLSDATVTLAEVLRDAGYATLMSGKWHVTHPDIDDDHNWPRRRGFDRFFGTLHGGGNYFDPRTLIEDETPIRAPESGFHYTDAITDRAVSFVESIEPDRPFLLYVAYTAPHWPLHAWPEDVARYEGRYASGWDAVRRARLDRLVDDGLVDASWALAPRDSRVRPWEEADHRDWEAARMAVYAAQVTQMDRGIGRIMDVLRARGDDPRTLVLFLSDNGGAAELIAPDTTNPVFPTHTRDGRPIQRGNVPGLTPGPEDTYQSYGVGWANASNTPFRLYKHFVHEGGIATPLIAHWPGVIAGGRVVHDQGHVVDVMATLVDLAGARYPARYRGRSIAPTDGISLRPVLEGGAMTGRREALFWEHEGNRAVRRGDWKAVARHGGEWELYHLGRDRTELRDLARTHPETLRELAWLWQGWADRTGVLPWPIVEAGPRVARMIVTSCSVEAIAC